MEVLVTVTSSGLYHRRYSWCNCPERADKYLQLFHERLFPASFIRPSTVFTFDVLDQFYVDALECKTAAFNYFNKLRRITNEAFPDSVPVR